MQLDGRMRSKFKENVEKEVEGEGGGGSFGSLLNCITLSNNEAPNLLRAKLRNLCTNASFLFSFSVLHVECE